MSDDVLFLIVVVGAIVACAALVLWLPMPRRVPEPPTAVKREEPAGIPFEIHPGDRLLLEFEKRLTVPQMVRSSELIKAVAIWVECGTQAVAVLPPGVKLVGIVRRGAGDPGEPKL